MPRPRSVISPPLLSRAKVKADKPDRFANWRPFQGLGFRVRQTAEIEGGGFVTPEYFSDDFDAELRLAELTDEGTSAILERAIPGGWAP